MMSPLLKLRMILSVINMMENGNENLICQVAIKKRCGFPR